MIQSDSPISEFKNEKFMEYLRGVKPIKIEEDFICVVNKTNLSECEAEEKKGLQPNERNRIYIENEKNSFQFTKNHLEVDMNHSFGIGIKKIVEEIEKGEKYER